MASNLRVTIVLGKMLFWLHTHYKTDNLPHNYSNAPSTDLPENFMYPIGTVVNSSHIFLAGVKDNYERAYLVNVDSWEFTRMPDMAEEKWLFSCGMVENKVVKLQFHLRFQLHSVGN